MVNSQSAIIVYTSNGSRRLRNERNGFGEILYNKWNKGLYNYGTLKSHGTVYNTQ